MRSPRLPCSLRRGLENRSSPWVPPSHQTPPSPLVSRRVLNPKWCAVQGSNSETGADYQGFTTQASQGDSQNSLLTLDADLKVVLEAWDRLSVPLKMAVLAIVKSAPPGKKRFSRGNSMGRQTAKACHVPTRSPENASCFRRIARVQVSEIRLEVRKNAGRLTL